MLQDLRAGRPTEVEAITGAIVQLARRHRIPVPLHEALATLIEAAERPR
jgi:2-dehydropantoate 2-reductase